MKNLWGGSMPPHGFFVSDRIPGRTQALPFSSSIRAPGISIRRSSFHH